MRLMLALGAAVTAASCGSSQTCTNPAGYEPAIVATNFSATITNPYLAYSAPGTVLKYVQSSGDVVEQDVLADTRTILGVKTLVVHDFLTSTSGQLLEDTYDYYAQDGAGNVWYFGEDTIAYSGTMSSKAGSWIAGEACAKPGMVMTANPLVGDHYRQEYLPGEAEDEAEVVSLTAPVTVPFGTFDNCLETKETSALAPGDVENKYYCSGLGLLLSADIGSIDAGKREELVSIDGRTMP